MPSNTLEDLRGHLFETLAALRRDKDPMDIDRAKTISEVAKTVIDSARVEVEYVKATGQDTLELPVFGAKDQKRLPGAPDHRVHRLK